MNDLHRRKQRKKIVNKIIGGVFLLVALSIIALGVYLIQLGGKNRVIFGIGMFIISLIPAFSAWYTVYGKDYFSVRDLSE